MWVCWIPLQSLAWPGSPAERGPTGHNCRLLLSLLLQDIFSLFHLDRPFKFVSKTSNFYIPIVGWSMFLTGACCFWTLGITTPFC